MLELIIQPYFFIPFILMIVCFIGLLTCRKKQFQIKHIHILSILILIILFINSGYIFYRTMIYSPIEYIIKKELKYKKIAALILGKYIAKYYCGKKVLIVTNYENNKYEKMLIDSLKEGFDGKVKFIIDYPQIVLPKELKEHPPINIIDLVNIFNIKDVTKKHQECEIVVLLFGLPFDFDNINILLDNTNKKWFFMFADLHFIYKFIYEKKIAGCIVFKPLKKYNPEDDIPDDVIKAFNKRFLLVTPKNITKIYERYPKLFK